MTTLSALRLIGKWCEARDFTASQLGPVAYAEGLALAEKAIVGRQKQTGEDRIHAAMALFKETDEAGHPIQAGLFVAALVDNDKGQR